MVHLHIIICPKSRMSKHRLEHSEKSWSNANKSVVQDVAGNVNNIVHAHVSASTFHTATNPGEPVKQESEADQGRQDSVQYPPIQVPLLVVDKVDDKPAFGDDFGPNATGAQKVAHEARAADAEPDEIVVAEAAPTLPHEENFIQGMHALLTFERTELHHIIEVNEVVSDHPSLGSSDTFKGEVSGGILSDSVPFSEVFGPGAIPTFPHELESSGSQSDESKILSEGEYTSPFSYEAGSSSAGNAPDEPTESKISSEVSENENLNVMGDDKFPSELDRTPTLPHEEGMSGVDRNHGKDPMFPDAVEASEFDISPQFSHETHSSGELDRGLDLPHERHDTKDEELASIEDISGPSSSLFTRTGSDLFSRDAGRGGSSDAMPRSDAEDEELKDPGLEDFPTERAQIFRRLTDISSHAAEDVTTHSPDIELVPGRSYTSLAAIQEVALQEEEEDAAESEHSSSVDLSNEVVSDIESEGDYEGVVPETSITHPEDVAASESVSDNEQAAPVSYDSSALTVNNDNRSTSSNGVVNGHANGLVNGLDGHANGLVNGTFDHGPVVSTNTAFENAVRSENNNFLALNGGPPAVPYNTPVSSLGSSSTGHSNASSSAVIPTPATNGVVHGEPAVGTPFPPQRPIPPTNNIWQAHLTNVAENLRARPHEDSSSTVSDLGDRNYSDLSPILGSEEGDEVEAPPPPRSFFARVLGFLLFPIRKVFAACFGEAE
jgi:hypothetical protein